MENKRDNRAISEFTDDELDEKIEKLYTIANSGNPYISGQAQQLLLDYLEEQDTRIEKQFEEYVNNNGIDMDKTINIGK